jgi:XapX domain-containing protein
MIQLVLSLVSGALLGAAFTLLGLPLPAPSTAAGVAGIIGVYFGMVFVSWWGKG